MKVTFGWYLPADTNKACTGDFGASSAAAAMASGLIALMLSAKYSFFFLLTTFFLKLFDGISHVSFSNGKPSIKLISKQTRSFDTVQTTRFILSLTL